MPGDDSILARVDVTVTEEWTPGRGRVGPQRLGRTITVHGITPAASMTPEERSTLENYYQRWSSEQAAGRLAPNPPPDEGTQAE
jgi:hypothetical protein